MQHVRLRSLGMAWFFALALCTVAATVATADSAPSASVEAQEAQAPDSSGPAAGSVAPPAITPAEEEWPLVDAAGNHYRIEKLPKREGAYRWLDENHVQMPLGTEFEVVKHDDQWFWVKYMKPQFNLSAATKKDKTPTPEELEQAAATYAFEIATGDRLGFEEFDRGLPRQGQWRNGFDVADMNGDGHLDIVFGPSRKATA